MTPLHRLDDWKVGLNGLGFSRHKPLEGYADAIVSIAKQHEIPVLDLFHVCYLNPNDSEIQRRFMPDGLHPNEDGHKIIADVVKEFLETL